MVLSPYQFLLALLGGYKYVGGLVFGKNGIPSIDVLFGDHTVFYVDAGSREAPWGPGGEYFLKLAVLAKARSNGVVEEKLFHPRLVAGRDVLPPVFMGRGGERVKQAAAYIVEIGSLLALLEDNYWESLLEGEGITASRPLVLIRHGPLLQMLHHYTSAPYVVDYSEAERLLSYSGLRRETIRELLDESLLCRDNGVDRNRVVLGLLALNILARLVDAASRGEAVVGGVVENTSRSRLLVYTVIARLVHSVLGELGGRKSADVSKLALSLKMLAERGYMDYGSMVAECLGVDEGVLYGVVGSGAEWAELVSAIRQSLVSRLSSLSLSSASIEQIELAAAWAGLGVDVYDVELFYSLYYLMADSSLYPATGLLRHSARVGMLEYYLGERARCHEDRYRDLLGKLARIVYRYLSPVELETCSSLRSRAKKAGIPVYELARLVLAPPPIRVEYVEGAGHESLLEALVVYPARILLYGYPPQLLVVDRYSRLGVSEIMGFRGLAESLAERIQPYASFIRGWEARVAATL